MNFSERLEQLNEYRANCLQNMQNWSSEALRIEGQIALIQELIEETSVKEDKVTKDEKIKK